MKINEDLLKNTVRADNQVNEKFKIINRYKEGEKVLFLGNSITLHETAPQIGWNWNFGMAATCEENDYVHKVVAGMELRGKKVNYCITNVGNWELEFWNDEVLESFYASKEYMADYVIFRLGENVKPAELKNHDFEKQYDKFFKYFTAHAKKVIVTDTFWENEELGKIIKKVAEKNGAIFSSVSDLGYENENKAIGKFENESVSNHPNDLGMERIAARILAAMFTD